MKKVHFLMLQLGNILAIVFIIYYILDIYNPMMKFIDNSTSKLLLLIFALVTLVSNQIVLYAMLSRKKKRAAGSEKGAAAAKKDKNTEIYVVKQQ